MYNAISGISEGKVADAYEYGNIKKNTTLMRALKIAGIAAVFCSFIALSLVLLRISGLKAPADGTNAGAESEMTTEAETEKSTVLDFVENPVVWCSVDDFYKIEPYKYFLPEKTPENFVDYVSSRWVAGEYLCTDGEYHTVKERGFITLGISAVNNEDGYVELGISISSEANDYAADNDPVKLSVDDVKTETFSATYKDGIYKTGIQYYLVYSAGGYLITYHIRILPSRIVDHPSAQDLFDIVTSAQYFKDHPLSAGNK